MSAYTHRVAHNILPLSRVQTLPQAFEEWEVNGILIDHEDAIEQCELCEQEGLRYQFGISNRLTTGRLLVGSKCILRFDIRVYSNGQPLSLSATRKHLNSLIEQKRVDSCIRALRSVAKAERNPILDGAIEYFEEKGNLSPKLAYVVLWRLRANRIGYDPDWFKIALRRQKHQDDLAAMPLARVHELWPALSASQRKLAERMGHAAPPLASSSPAPSPKRVIIGKGTAFTYEQWIAAGWTDELLLAHRMMQP